jgi:hypothetical protein
MLDERNYGVFAGLTAEIRFFRVTPFEILGWPYRVCKVKDGVVNDAGFDT